MSLVGKIFTMLILVLSIVFMSFAMMVFATHKNWKDNAKDLNAKLTTANAALKDAKETLQRLENEQAREQAARKAALAALQVRVATAEQRLSAKEKELGDLTAAHSQATATAKEAQTRLAAIEKEAADLRGSLRAEQQKRDQMFITVVDLTDKLNQAESLRQNLEEVNRQATQQMSQMKMVLDRNGLTPDSASVAHIPPKVDGVVLEVSDKDLLEISIGADDGLKVGHSLDVYRGNTYLGRIVIKKTNPDRAVGQVKKELQRGQIKRGDRVTTKFS
jgi:hypothetical protein